MSINRNDERDSTIEMDNLNARIVGEYSEMLNDSRNEELLKHIRTEMYYAAGNVDSRLYKNIIPTDRYVVDTYIYKINLNIKFWNKAQYKTLMKMIMDILKQTQLNDMFLDKFSREYRIVASAFDFEYYRDKSECISLRHKFITINNVLNDDIKYDIRNWYYQKLTELNPIFERQVENGMFFLDEKELATIVDNGCSLEDLRVGKVEDKYKHPVQILLEDQLKEDIKLSNTVSITEKGMQAERKKKYGILGSIFR